MRIYLAILAVLLVFIVSGLVHLKITNKPKPIPLPVQQAVLPTDKLRTKAGEPLSGLQNSSQATIHTKPDGSVEYRFKTRDPFRDSLIVSRNNQVVFEREQTLLSDGKYPKLADFQQKYGLAEEIATGSAHFGDQATTYIYASKGLALIGNDYNGDIYEIQSFKSMSSDEYKKAWGVDIHQYSPQNE